MADLNYEEFLQKFIDFANFKLVKAYKPHGNYVRVLDDRMKDKKCEIFVKITKEDLFVNFLFDKEVGVGVYNKLADNQKDEVENSVKRFGEVIWTNIPGNHPYIQVRKPISQFKKDEEKFYWFKDVVLNLYECCSLSFK